MLSAKEKINDLYTELNNRISTQGQKYKTDINKHVENIYEHLKKAVKSL
jgi:thiamine pyrophosphokinase